FLPLLQRLLDQQPGAAFRNVEEGDGQVRAQPHAALQAADAEDSKGLAAECGAALAAGGGFAHDGGSGATTGRRVVAIRFAPIVIRPRRRDGVKSGSADAAFAPQK